MIKFFDDSNKIIPLWQEAFGDSKEDILFFLKNCKKKTALGFFDDGELCSMLFLVDCKLSGEKCKYIYAACTYKNHRGKGYMSNLLEYCQENYDLLSLIPADNSLVRFYNKCAFTYREDIVNIYFDESEDIEEYLEYLRYYVTEDGKEHTNGERGIMRKLACLRTLYRYFYKKESIKTNPASIVDMPKIHEKEIVRLDADEVSVLLDQVELGDKLTKSQQKFHDKTKTRDMAILTLLLGTGMRVSECVGIDINDIDFKNSGIKIRRKGGNETVIYFGEEVENALLDYLEERKLIVPQDGHENALFLSLQKRRIGVRAVENLVKKYSSLVTNLKKITPHKLRSTYGTALYKETGDIYLVADILGHKDVNTTKKHYAAIEDERRRKARNAVKLRKD